MGGQTQTRPRARDAGTVRLGASPQRCGTLAGCPGRHRDPSDPRRRCPQRCPSAGGRHPGVGEPEGQQKRNAMGFSAIGGSHGRHRGDVLPAHLLQLWCRHRRRCRRAGQRQGGGP